MVEIIDYQRRLIGEREKNLKLQHKLQTALFLYLIAP